MEPTKKTGKIWYYGKESLLLLEISLNLNVNNYERFL